MDWPLPVYDIVSALQAVYDTINATFATKYIITHMNRSGEKGGPCEMTADNELNVYKLITARPQKSRDAVEATPKSDGGDDVEEDEQKADSVSKRLRSKSGAGDSATGRVTEKKPKQKKGGGGRKRASEPKKQESGTDSQEEEDASKRRKRARDEVEDQPASEPAKPADTAKPHEEAIDVAAPQHDNAAPASAPVVPEQPVAPSPPPKRRAPAGPATRGWHVHEDDAFAKYRVPAADPTVCPKLDECRNSSRGDTEMQMYLSAWEPTDRYPLRAPLPTDTAEERAMLKEEINRWWRQLYGRAIRAQKAADAAAAGKRDKKQESKEPVPPVPLPLASAAPEVPQDKALSSASFTKLNQQHARTVSTLEDKIRQLDQKILKMTADNAALTTRASILERAQLEAAQVEHFLFYLQLT